MNQTEDKISGLENRVEDQAQMSKEYTYFTKPTNQKQNGRSTQERDTMKSQTFE